MKLIPLDAVLAEIKEWLTEIEKLSHSKEADDEYGKGFCDGRRGAYRKILSSINSLEVKEEDLEKEIQRQYNIHKNSNNIAKNCVIMTKGGFEYFAKYFFELGVNASNPLTWEDTRLIAEIGDKFMNSEESDNLSEEEYYTEILNRFKAQKGE